MFTLAIKKDGSCVVKALAFHTLVMDHDTIRTHEVRELGQSHLLRVHSVKTEVHVNKTKQPASCMIT